MHLDPHLGLDRVADFSAGRIINNPKSTLLITDPTLYCPRWMDSGTPPFHRIIANPESPSILTFKVCTRDYHPINIIQRCHITFWKDSAVFSS